jgi:outer membrane autotransporter protein
MTVLLKSIKKLSRIGFEVFRPKWPPRPNLAPSGKFSLEVYSRPKATVAARIAGPVAILCALPGFASAQDATWMGPTPDWNISANWNPMTTPGPNGTATFGGALPTSISMAGGVAVGALQFNAPNYTFDALDGLTINGNGVNASLANAPTFNVIGSPGHSTPAINFNGTSSAGTAQIILGQQIDTNNGFNAGFINFSGNSTAGQATITVRDQSAIIFSNSSTADHATLIVNQSGFIGFVGTSNGDQATIINNADGEVKIANLTTGGTSFGSIAGAGTFNLGSKQLTVGSNNDSTTVSGVIEDHFPGSGGDVGGSLVKVGTGTLTLTGVNPYTGGTTVSGGVLVVGDFANPSAALSGGGPISVGPGGTLGGYGSVTGSVVNSGAIAAGSATPGFLGSPMGAFTINGNYVGSGGTLAINTFLGGDGSPSDRLVISGGAATGATTVQVTNVGGPGAETTGNGIQVVSAINGASTAAGAFMLSSGELRAGAFDYDLFRGSVDTSAPNDWFLRSDFIVPPVVPPIGPPETSLPSTPPPEPLPPGVYPIIGPEIATYGVVQPLARQLGLASLGTLNDRAGDTYTEGSAPCVTASAPVVRKGPELAPAASTAGCGLTGWPSSVWGRFFGQSIDTHYRAFADPRADGHLAGFQAGIDLLRGSFIAGQEERAGLYVAYGNTDVDVKGLVTNPAATAYILSHTGKLDLDAWSGGAYWTHVGPGGWYLDAVLQATRYGGSATTDFAKLDTSGTGFISSLEGGYPFALPQFGPGFVIEPQAQILWQRVAFENDNDGLGDVGLGKTSGTSGRVGVRAKWTILTAGDQVWQPYLRANLWEDWGAQARTIFSGTDVTELLARGKRLQFGGGLTTKINPNLSLYANADYEFAVGNTDGGKRDGIRGAVGLRYSW